MFQNVSIRSKLIGILVGPLLALTILASVGIGTNLAESVKANQVNQLSAFTGKLTALAHELQKERSQSSQFVGSRRTTGYERLTTQRGDTDRAVQAYRSAVAALDASDAGRGLQAALGYGVSELDKLKAQRGVIDDAPLPNLGQSGPATSGGAQTAAPGTTGAPGDHPPIRTVAQALDQYDDTIGDLLNINSQIAFDNAGNDRRLLRTLTTLDSLSRLKEFTDQEHGFVSQVIGQGSDKRFEQGQFGRYAAIVAAENLWLGQFRGAAAPEQRRLYDTTVAGPDMAQAQKYQQALLASENAPQITVDPGKWDAVMGNKVDLLRRVELGLNGAVTDQSAQLKAAADRRALLYSIALTIVLWLAVGLSLFTARSMVGPLRLLKDAADDVARHKLPSVVERLQRSQRVDLDAETAPIAITSRDEIGQVAEAFNEVHRTAVHVAGEQAALRTSVGDMFLNLARRSQSLVDRQLELIDDLERGETDPDALENLFRLDHLATRMRRNAENLIVLSGSEPARRWSEPVALVDIVRAAIAEVEDYTRVELLPIEPLGIAGQAVGDVVHMLAELIENATAFSPPGTKVQIAGQNVSSGYVIEVEDRGLGMTDAELVEANERLAHPPTIDLALSRMLGIYVVSRLAARYGIKVQLRHSWYGGVTALVLFPEALVVRPAVAGSPLPPVQVTHTRTELPPPAAPAAAAPMSSIGPPPSTNGPARTDSLPIFEAARSDWFETGSAAAAAHLPLRRHAAQLNGDGEVAGGLTRGRNDDAFGIEAPAPSPVEAPAPAAPAAPPPAAPAPAPEPESAAPPPAPAPAPPPAPEPVREAPAQMTTKAGLPRRIPKANLNPEISEPAPSWERPQVPAGYRSPGEVRSMLSSYRTGLERGRSAASSVVSGRDRDAEEPIGGDAAPHAVEE
jgi:signal transduction histidine kinase